MTTLLFIQTILNGLTIGALYVMMALGFALIFGIVRIVNFAHGEFYMLGAFFVYMLFGIWKVVGYLPAVLISAVSVGLIGMVFERTIFRPIRANGLQVLITSFAMSIGIQQIAILFWGAEDLSIPPPYTGTLHWEPLIFPYDRVIVVGYTILILIGFYYLLKRTKIGLAMEAVVQDKEAAQIQGIRVNFVYLISFGIATLLAGAAGGLVGPIFALTPHMGGMPLMRAFMAVILGGMGNVNGAVVGGLLIGVSESFLTTFFGGAFAAIMTFIVIMIILVVKPSGLFGEVGA
ncbi:MAG: branched-chain amino acid ABC transporter permease [Pseudomonadota bacterium]